MSENYPKGFIVVCRRDLTDDGVLAFREDYKSAVDFLHQQFLDNDFCLRDGKPFDPGHDDGEDGGFEIFDSFELFEGKISAFSFDSGDGPSGFIVENQ